MMTKDRHFAFSRSRVRVCQRRILDRPYPAVGRSDSSTDGSAHKQSNPGRVGSRRGQHRACSGLSLSRLSAWIEDHSARSVLLARFVHLTLMLGTGLRMEHAYE